MTPRCPNGTHKGPIQDFTEVCLACGHNIYESDEEYENALDAALATSQDASAKNRIAEKERLLATKQAGEQKPPCPHHNVQQFTDVCLDCGKNVNC